MTNWNEADHPRDGEGKFTYKNGGGSGSSSNKTMNREDILYPNMKNKKSQINNENIGLGNYNNENLSREDILYPTMKNKQHNGIFTGGAASADNSVKTEDWKTDKEFNKALEYLYPQEGGYSNRKADLGGPTKLGVTQSTYDWYNKRNNLPTQNVKNITKNEAAKIYYDYFWKESGASLIEDKGLALMYFDAAVNHGPYYAKKYYKESKGDCKKFIELRQQHYKRMADNIPKQKENYNGWINRLDNMQKYIEKNY